MTKTEFDSTEEINPYGMASEIQPRSKDFAIYPAGKPTQITRVSTTEYLEGYFPVWYEGYDGRDCNLYSTIETSGLIAIDELGLRKSGS